MLKIINDYIYMRMGHKRIKYDRVSMTTAVDYTLFLVVFFHFFLKLFITFLNGLILPAGGLYNKFIIIFLVM